MIAELRGEIGATGFEPSTDFAGVNLSSQKHEELNETQIGVHIFWVKLGDLHEDVDGFLVASLLDKQCC